MSDKCIAVVGLSPVCAAGIRSFLKDAGIYDVEIYGNLNVELETSDKPDGYVVSSDVFAMRPDFFMMRRNRIAVYCRNRSTGSISGGVPVIGENDDESVIRDTLATMCQNIFGQEEERSGLSNREIEVLKRVASGMINKEIAEELNISVNTVITHRKNISVKLGIRSVSGLSLYALMNGLV